MKFRKKAGAHDHGAGGHGNGHNGHAAKETRKILYWVAPMDADFRRDEPGKSPMGMDLVPVYEGDSDHGDHDH